MGGREGVSTIKKKKKKNKENDVLNKALEKLGEKGKDGLWGRIGQNLKRVEKKTTLKHLWADERLGSAQERMPMGLKDRGKE